MSKIGPLLAITTVFILAYGHPGKIIKAVLVGSTVLTNLGELVA